MVKLKTYWITEGYSVRFAISIATLFAAALLITACKNEPGTPAANNSKNTASPPAVTNTKDAHALPNNAFKAELTLVDPPAKLRVGQRQTIQVKIKNASDAQWFARGGEVNRNPDNRFYLAVGDRWLKSDGKTLVSNMDGRHGLQKDLKPGEEEEVALQITAPKDAGDYVLEIDLVQEQVAWFGEKGSTTAKTRVTVVR